ncbi:MAG TPA: hypothetical protein VD861_02950 [Pyrinomonadaceae bacterium]|nr:hypothetical protein [Pyrinomonadaceae bacterium]
MRVSIKPDHRRSILLTSALLLLFGFAPAARAQLCLGSHIYLVVRDENGRVIDPTPLGARRSLARTFDFVSVKEIDVPAGYGVETRRAKALVFSDDGCDFRPVEEATFERRGKRMRLVFRNAARDKDRSVFYTIDLPPFSQGTLEIDLSGPAGRLPEKSQRRLPDTDLPHGGGRDCVGRQFHGRGPGGQDFILHHGLSAVPDRPARHAAGVA